MMTVFPRSNIVLRRRFSLRFAVLISMLIITCSWDGHSSAQGGQQIQPLVALSSASFLRDTPVAPGSLVSAFTAGVLQPGTQIVGNDANPSTPEFELPVLLGNLTVEVHGRSAGIFGIFGTPSFDQFNILIPTEVVPGKGPIVVKDVTGRILAAGEIEIAEIAPTIFTANVNGQGVPAAYILRVLGSGEQRIEQVADFNPNAGVFAPRPIDLERSDELTFLILFLTGGRGIVAARDNQYEGYIELKSITGPTAVAKTERTFTNRLIAPVQTRDGAEQPAPVIFDAGLDHPLPRRFNRQQFNRDGLGSGKSAGQPAADPIQFDDRPTDFLRRYPDARRQTVPPQYRWLRGQRNGDALSLRPSLQE
jgi:hypothetical protein